MDALSWILLLAVSFVSSIIGSMIGTAMLILPPTMIFLGIPIHTAVATARFSMVGIGIGNLSNFSLKQKIRLKYVVPFAIAGVIGSLISSFSLKNINEEILKTVIGVLMIAISLLILFEERIVLKKKKPEISLKRNILSILGGFFVGGYLGIVGGGGATITIFLLVMIYGLSFRDAVVNQKAVTMPISIITTIAFIYQGLINYKIGVPLLLVNIAGGWMGAALLLKFKNVWLKMLLVPVIVIMAIKLIFF